jgi:hypothetical protein
VALREDGFMGYSSDLVDLYASAVHGETVISDCTADTCTYDINQFDQGCTRSSLQLGKDSISFGGGTTTYTGTAPACCGANSCLGGAIWTQAFAAKDADSTVFFSYSAQGGSDWYEAAIVLYKLSSPISDPFEASVSDLANAGPVEVKVVRGSTVTKEGEDFATKINPGSQYVIAFFMASFDKTNGGALGAAMSVSGFGRKV